MLITGAPVSDNALVSKEARDLIRSWTREHITANKVYLTSVVKCPHTKDPTKLMIQCCEERLRQELLNIQPDVIICMGKAAAVPFNLGGKMTELLNRVMTVKPLTYSFSAPGKDTKRIVTREAKIIVTYDPVKFVSDIKVRSAVEACFRQAERLSLGATIKPPDKYYLIESPREFEDWVERHLTDERLNKRIHAFDIETNGRLIHPKTEFDAQYPPKLRCVSFSWGPGMAICVPYEDDPAYHVPLKRFMESDIQFTGHNVAFDIFFLKLVNDIHTKHLFGDTMLMAAMLNPGKGKYGYGLKPLAAEWTDLGGYETDMKSTPDTLDDQGRITETKWEKVDMDVMAPYNCADADATLQIYHIFMGFFKQRKMLPAHWVMTHALFPLAEMEHNGFLVDRNWVDTSRKKIEDIVARYEQKLKELCGGKEYLWSSPDALSMVMYDEFKYPVPNLDPFAVGRSDEDDSSDSSRPTNDAALSIINTPFTQTIRKYRRATKLLSTFFNGYLVHTGLDNRLRADFNLVGTVTGRLSSSGDANLQNIPSGMPSTAPGYEELHEFKVKKAFIPRPGWKIVNADQSQLELRIAGAVSNEELFIKSYKNQIDMHSRNAKVSFGLQVDQREYEAEALAKGFLRGSEDFNVYVERAVCKYIKKHYPEERQAAKTVSFGILYGMSKWGLAQSLNADGRDAGSTRIWTPDECQQLISKFKLGYPTLTRWQAGLIQFAHKNGYTYTVFGRRRYLPDINSADRQLKGRAERAAINTPVQSAGSDFMMSGVYQMYKELDYTKYRFCATVHDSIVCEVQEDYIPEFCKISKQCLEHPHIGNTEIPLCSVMPFIAEFEVGNSYGTMEGYEV